MIRAVFVFSHILTLLLREFLIFLRNVRLINWFLCFSPVILTQSLDFYVFCKYLGLKALFFVPILEILVSISLGFGG